MKWFLRYLDPDGGDGGDGGTAVKIDNKVDPAAYTPPELDMATALPPEYRDKPYFKEKSFVDIIKEHDNLQGLMGKRPAGIPKDDAPAEEWDKFIGATRPKSADEYVLPETEFSKAGKRNAGLEKAVRDMALEIGIPKRQFGKLVEKIEGHLAEAERFGGKQTEDQLKAKEVEFEGLLDKVYMKDKQIVLDRTKKLMVESVDPAHKDKVEGVLKDISNETLFALTAVLDGVYKKYIAEDRSPDGDINAGGDAASLETEARKIMMSPEYKDFRVAGHEEAKQKVQDLFQRIAAMKNK